MEIIVIILINNFSNIVNLAIMKCELFANFIASINRDKGEE